MKAADESGRSKSPAWGRIGLIGLILAGAAAFFALGGPKLVSFETLKTHRESLAAFVAGQPILAAGIYAVTYAVFTLAMIPGALWLTIAGGFLFGLAGGTALTAVAATVGATGLFLLARTTLGDALRRRAGPFMSKLEAGFQANPRSYMLTLRFLPVVPFPVANIAPALFGAKLRDFVLTTAFGILPGCLAYSWIGAGLGASLARGQAPDVAQFARDLAPAFLALAAVSLMPVLVKALTRKKGSTL